VPAVRAADDPHIYVDRATAGAQRVAKKPGVGVKIP
jgi:hypothetical protein